MRLLQLLINASYGSNFMTILDSHQSLKNLAIVERLFWQFFHGNML